ncbi:MAG: hypothetical protein AAFX50_11305, partial [Acidobacteriota bacterium]
DRRADEAEEEGRCGVSDKLVYLQCFMVLGTRRISMDANSLTLSPEKELKEANNFELPSKLYKKGIESAAMTIAGQTSGAFERAALEQLKNDDEAQLFQFHGQTEAGGFAIFRQVQVGALQWSGGKGDIAEFSLPTGDFGDLYLGYVLHCPLGTPGVTASGATAAVEMRPVADNEKLVMAINVVDPPGVLGSNPALGVALESHPDATFSAPVTRLQTSADFTTLGQVLLEVPGPITDSFFRLAWSVGGSDPVFFAAVSAAIVEA